MNSCDILTPDVQLKIFLKVITESINKYANETLQNVCLEAELLIFVIRHFKLAPDAQLHITEQTPNVFVNI